MSYHHKSGAQKSNACCRSQRTEDGQQHGFDVAEYCEGIDRERNQCSVPSAEAMTAPSDSEIAIERLSAGFEIQEEVS